MAGGRLTDRESARIALLAKIYGDSALPGVVRAIGDDAALLDPGGETLVWTVDVLVEGVHFRSGWLSLEDLGYRATMAAASDIAAMAGRPRGVLCSLVLPTSMGDPQLTALARGRKLAADELGTAIIGGNLARGTELSITTTVLGAAPRPCRRDGARVGDDVLLCGPVGWAAAGRAILSRLESGQLPRHADRSAQALCVEAFRRPRARIDAGLQAGPMATAGIDVSDGLARDLARLIQASPQERAPIQVVLDETAIVEPELREVAAAIGEAPLEWALHGGEDYALLITAPADQVPEGFVPIGRCVPATSGHGAVALQSADGSMVAVPPRGFDHFE